MKRIPLLLISVILHTHFLWGETSLYGPSIPENTALVRVFNGAGGSPSAASGIVDIGHISFEFGYTGDITPYRPLAPDVYVIAAGSLRREFLPEPETCYTIILTDDDITVLGDITHTDPARTQIYVYNLSGISVIDLTAADGQIMVIEGVENMKSAMTAVNPVPVQFMVTWGAEAGLKVPAFRPRRGESFSIFVPGPADNPAVYLHQAVVDMKSR